MMEKINDFLNRSNLTIRDEIILIIISLIIGSILFPIVINFFKFLFYPYYKKITIYIEKRKNESDRNKRIKKGNLLYGDYEYLQKKDNDELTDYEKKALNNLEQSFLEELKNKK